MIEGLKDRVVIVTGGAHGIGNSDSRLIVAMWFLSLGHSDMVTVQRVKASDRIAFVCTGTMERWKDTGTTSVPNNPLLQHSINPFCLRGSFRHER